MSCNVIIVGTGASLLTIKKGKDIDSFDYVMRSARCFVDDANWSWREYTGTKTSLVWVTYYHFNQLEKLPADLDILCLFNNPDFYEEPNNIYKPYSTQEQINRYYFDKIATNSKFYFVSSNNNNTMHSNYKLNFTDKNIQNKTRFSAGIQAVNHALMHFKNVYITGFDHFQTGYYFNSDATSKRSAHNSFLEACYIQSLLKNKIINKL